MKPFFATLATALALASLQTAAHAHFIWATVQNNQVRFALLENIAEAPSAKFEKYVANLTPRSGNKKLTLGEVKDGARFAPLVTGQTVVVVDSVIGAKEREGTAYLLVYHAKGAASLAAAGTNAKDPVEIQAHREGQSLVLSLHQNQQPVVESEVWVQWPGEENPSSVKTDAQGNAKADWPAAPQSGFVGIRAMSSEATAGELEGKKYASIHHWATLTFPVEGSKPAEAPRATAVLKTVADTDAEAAKPTRADPAAWELLRSAHDLRYVVPTTFHGVTAEIVLEDATGAHTGTLTYAAGKPAEIHIEGAGQDSLDWVKGQIGSAFGHRQGGDFARGEGANPITFGTSEGADLLGKQVQLNDSAHSFYRVHDGIVSEVTRTMGASRFTISILETQWVEGHKYLPHTFVVTYFDARTGALSRSESFTDSFVTVSGVWLPQSRRVLVAQNGTITARRFTLKNPRLLDSTTASAK